MNMVVLLSGLLGFILAVTAFTVSSAVGVPDLNVTALRGQDAKLPCSVDSLSENITVVWMDKHDNVLYFNENRMIDDLRFAMSKLNRNWDLVIRQVDAHDEGSYRCIANTEPIKLKYYQLTVYVPPKIDPGNSSPDVEASEGTSVMLECNTTGYPPPSISWSKRRAGEPKNSTNIIRLTTKGTTLQVPNVSRYQDEIYTCTASNGYGMPDEHDIRIRVRFKPEVTTSQKKISQYAGNSVQLTCIGTGFRTPNMYFAKNNIQIVDNEMRQHKHKYIWIKNTDVYRTWMTLIIYNLGEEDFGYYKCVAINSLGRAEKFIELKVAKQVVTPEVQNQSKLTSTPLKRKETTTTKAIIYELPPELDKDRKANAAIAKQSKENKATGVACALLFIVTPLSIILS